MAGSLINKYIWLIDTIQRRGRITRKEINAQWRLSPYSDGGDLPRRTFLNYRNGIADMFKINIDYDPATFEYYIDNTNTDDSEARVLNWLIDSMALSGMMRDSKDIANLIMVENVPSAREHLPNIINALRQRKRITFQYKSYNRSNPSDVVLEPYFLRIFKQLWYVIGRNTRDNKVKTYALDRMANLHTTSVDYTIPDNFNGEVYFKDCFGITTSQAEAKNIMLRVESKQAKYFRALPLHHSQSEEVHDQYSIFHYKMQITYDLMQQLLSYGPDVEVVQPIELRVAMKQRLTEALNQYK